MEAAIVDVDGTVIRGSQVLPEATVGLGDLRDAGLSVCFLSNNPTKTPAEYRDRLIDAGLATHETPVVTSMAVTADVLAEQHPTAGVYLVGDPPLRAYLTDRGVDVVDRPARADVVVGSLDTGVTYEDLAAGIRALERDVPFYGTDPDARIPTKTGAQPGSGVVLAALEAGAGRPPDAILGKPAETAAQAALERLGTTADETLVVGDRVDTDVALGVKAGMETVLVDTGIDIQPDGPEPDHRIEGIGDIASILG